MKKHYCGDPSLDKDNATQSTLHSQPTADYVKHSMHLICREFGHLRVIAFSRAHELLSNITEINFKYSRIALLCVLN
jgi:hypothetical protein